MVATYSFGSVYSSSNGRQPITTYSRERHRPKPLYSCACMLAYNENAYQYPEIS